MMPYIAMIRIKAGREGMENIKQMFDCLFVCLFVEFMAGQTLICKFDVWQPNDMSDMLVGFSGFTIVTKWL